MPAANSETLRIDITLHMQSTGKVTHSISSVHRRKPIVVSSFMVFSPVPAREYINTLRLLPAINADPPIVFKSPISTPAVKDYRFVEKPNDLTSTQGDERMVQSYIYIRITLVRNSLFYKALNHDK